MKKRARKSQEFEELYHKLTKDMGLYKQKMLLDKLVQEVLTKKEAAKFLRISIATLDRWMKAKRVPFSKLEGRVLFLREELFKWLRAKQVGAVERRKS